MTPIEEAREPFELEPRDQQHLRLLTVSYYLFAALEGFFAVVAVLDLTGRGGSSAALIATLTVFFGVVSILSVFAGLRLKQRRARSFCLFVAALNCLIFPFGTVLGVATMFVLKRPRVRSAFGDDPRLANVAAWEDRPLP